MLKRTLFFVNPYHLSVRNNQLVVRDKEKSSEKTVPIEDIGYVVLDNQQISFTQSVTEYFALNNVATIFCNEKHHPVGMMLNLDSNHLQGEVFDIQINASEPLKKNLWQYTVQCKIKNQAVLLKNKGLNYEPMLYFAKEVKSGDTGNVEARAAKHYWQNLFAGTGFRREREGEQPNSLFNYAYAVLRAATAKALSGSGLLPTFGIHHRNRYNAYRLADDIMEPYRPIVDELVLDVYSRFSDYEDLTTEIKMDLLQLLTLDVKMDGLKRPLGVALSMTTASLVRCFRSEIRKISYPEFC
jgi:CRISPR-associated protein Cas1